MREPTSSSIVFHFKDGKMLVREAADEDMGLPGYGDFGDDVPLIYLFSISEEPFFLIDTFEVEIPSGFTYQAIRSVRNAGKGPQYQMFAAFTAWHLYGWYNTNRFCGHCGGKTDLATEERAVHCADCGNTIYPRINPAVIVAVRNEERILLTKYHRMRDLPYYALVAGFCEIGETLEETVAREVMEETGLRVKNITYYKSQPWGIASDLLAGFFCDVDGDSHIRMDESELCRAEWVAREDVPLQPDDFALTNEMMKVFREGKDRL